MGREDASPLTGGDDDSITISSGAMEFLKDPRSWLATVVVGWVLDLWGSILGYVDAGYATLSTIPKVAIYDPITAAFGAPGTAIQDAWIEVGTIAADVAEPAGVFAPIVVVGIWLIPAILGATVLYFLWGVLDTYLPLSALPGTGGRR
ncbi:hypothetical protein HSRCO_0746 [Halanaeroarchaeum sp. HSR-CO]|uniref:hypothetical protein n=1 Tax=Halanaeroarchaeum sp. HSR-CO TaxID=2866382 RepID=UPI00217E4E04|nr:hypothetical protein [Halanaeroarchaeum sp. HSR-CO]UWG47040.1 hypothetical protein HSRCO_0746 [Halanaeroarchaeum sp. HSR-CO]